MFVALDENGNRVYADIVEKGTACFCPVCNEALRLHRAGKYRPHFAHLPKTICLYYKDKDYKTEWHLRMQGYFPREACEVRFVDEETGEVHIADVFLEASDTVLEFQHSPITEEEFRSRTEFHLKNGRRIVWLFDESAERKNNTFGRFRYDEDICWKSVPFYQWLGKPRQFLDHGWDLKQNYDRYSICVFTGEDEITVRRIVGEHGHFQWVGFSREIIQMGSDLAVEDFFTYDPYWEREDREKARIEAIKRQNEFILNQRMNYAIGQIMNQKNKHGRGRRF